MPKNPPITTILVPQGAEYKAVYRGLKPITGAKPTLLSIPVGMQPLRQYLQQWNGEIPSRVLLMGLCGSLQKRHTVGDIVLYEDCVYQEKLQKCDSSLTAQIHTQLQNHRLVRGLTSDRIISSATEKQHLGKISGADVVDMEGFTALEFCQSAGVAAAILRVVSDDSHHDIPNLTSVISPDGSLQPLKLTWAFIRQPLAASNLIRGSLQGLKVLEQVTTLLFSTY